MLYKFPVVIIIIDKADYPEHLHVVFCPNKHDSFEPFMCLDLANAMNFQPVFHAKSNNYLTMKSLINLLLGTVIVNQKQISVLHLIFHSLPVVYVLPCSLKREITP